MLNLTKDSDLHFPHVMFVEASAGSGKTYLLSLRFVQFLLSERVPHNKLNNMLAITFTNNAAYEMKKRILGWLKKIALSKLNENEEESIKSAFQNTDNLKEKSKKIIEDILDNYHSFNVSTIDSFMTRIATASALELGLSPDFEILMSKTSLTEEALYTYINSLTKEELVKLLHSLRKGSESIDFYLVETLKDRIGNILKEEDYTSTQLIDPDIAKEEIDNEIEGLLAEMEKLFEEAMDNGLGERLPDFHEITEHIKEGKFHESLKIKNARAPLLKEINRKLDEIRGYLKLKAELPDIRLAKEVKDIIYQTLHKQGKIHIGEITTKLRDYINNENIPSIYFSLGEKLYHFLIDEFQDTNPLQWHNLKILIEESLSRGGSLFIVGDVKQAIYGFRGSDYQIMKNLKDGIKNGVLSDFPSIPRNNIYTLELTTNFRSHGNIVDYVDRVFKVELKDKLLSQNDPAGFLEYTQNPLPDRREKGYINTIHIEKSEVRDKILYIISEAIQRGFKESHIAILVSDNDYATEISGWLTEEGYRVISESGTDIRTRKIVMEIVYLLKFLDSPIDDFSFAMFLLGDIAQKTLGNNTELIKEQKGKRNGTPLYRIYRNKSNLLWAKYFEQLFKEVGYLSTYDLLLRIVETFSILENFPEETTAILRLLDTALYLEERGKGSIKHLIDLLESDDDTDVLKIDTSSAKEGIHVMTIHKAKGLEFDIVINVIHKNVAMFRAGKDYLFHFPLKNKVIFTHINKDQFTEGTKMKTTYEKGKQKAIIENLNKQYVAMTRAKYELYNIVILTGTKKPEPTMNIESTEIGKKAFPSTEKKEILQLKPHPKIQLKDYSEERAFAWTSHRVFETKRGEFYHAIMSEILYTGDMAKLQNIIEKYQKLLKFEEPDTHEKIKNAIYSLSEYFLKKDNRHVRTEITFIDKNGNILRMDRVIIDSEEITVIDFKTGHIEDENTYKEQITTYMRILKEIYPEKKVKGIIYNIDTGEVYEY